MLLIYPPHPFSIVLKRFWRFTVVSICFTKQKTSRIITYRTILFCVETIIQFHSSAQGTKKYVTFRYDTVEGKPALISHPMQLCWLIELQYLINTTLLLCKGI